MMKLTKEILDDLTGRFGCPLYVFDEAGFIQNAKLLDEAMKARYPRYRIAYSYKTNYTPYICSAAKRLGAFAEVVSGMEYDLAKRIGYEDSQIIFNGPDKGAEGREAFLRGCMIHADSLDELRMLCETARSVPDRAFRVGLRINIDVGQGFVSRFGMEEKDAEEAVSLVARVPNLKIAGLHCHISRCRGKEAWRLRTVGMLSLADRLFEEPPDFIDLGSGMFGSMDPEFASQFNDVPSYEDYAEVTAGLMAEHYPGPNGPVLITEPGTTLVSRFVDCVSRVVAIKRVRGHDFAILNAGIHTLGETCMLKRLPLRVFPCGTDQREFKDLDLTGYTCLEQDVLFSAYSGKLAVGDTVVFGNVGGYSNVLKPPFIRPNCAMIALRPDGSCQLIKRAESYDDLLQTYVL